MFESISITPCDFFSEADLNHTLERLKRLEADFLDPEVKSLIPSMRKSRKLLGLINVIGDIGHELLDWPQMTKWMH